MVSSKLENYSSKNFSKLICELRINKIIPINKIEKSKIHIAVYGFITELHYKKYVKAGHRLFSGILNSRKAMIEADRISFMTLRGLPRDPDALRRMLGLDKKHISDAASQRIGMVP